MDIDGKGLRAEIEWPLLLVDIARSKVIMNQDFELCPLWDSPRAVKQGLLRENQ